MIDLTDTLKAPHKETLKTLVSRTNENKIGQMEDQKRGILEIPGALTGVVQQLPNNYLRYANKALNPRKGLEVSSFHDPNQPDDNDMTAISMILHAIHDTNLMKLMTKIFFLAIEMDFLPSSSSTFACIPRAHYL